MFSKMLRTSAYSLALFALTMPAVSAQDFVGSGPGASIPDFNTANNVAGSAVSTFTITEEDSLTIEDLSVCIDGLNHTWVGDLIATVTHTDTDGVNTTATLFNRVNRFPFGGDGDASNLDGDYEFASTGASLWEESNRGSSGNGTQGTVDDEFTITPGRYANVNSTGFDNNQNPDVESPSSLVSIFGGTQSAGTWTIRFTDNDVNDTGSFTGTSIKFNAQAIPEPGTVGLMAMASIGGFFYIRRKKKNESAQADAQDA